MAESQVCGRGAGCLFVHMLIEHRVCMAWSVCINFACLLQYSFSLTTFSPSGKLVQIEYALNAVAAGATSLGIRATDGVVIATEKKLPSVLVDESTVNKIAMLTPNVGVVYSGMGPDFRVLVRKARKTAQAYHRLYQEHIPVAQLVRETAAVMQEFTRKYPFVRQRTCACLHVCTSTHSNI